MGPQKDLFQLLRQRPLSLGRYIDWVTLEQIRLADDVRAFITTAQWDRFFALVEPTYMELTLEFCATLFVQQVMTVHDDPGTITFRLDGLVCQMSIPKFDTAMELYIEEFIRVKNFLRLHRHIYYSQS